MQITCFSGFSKKPNSTKQPSGGTSKTVVLKQPTAVINPVFVMEDYDLSYNYIQWGSRFYYVDDIVIVHNNIAEYHCSTDVLATYKSDIGSSSQYVTRAYSNYDGDIIDHFYPAIAELTETVSDPTQSPGWVNDYSSGQFVIGIMGANSGPNGGAVTYYAMKSGGMAAITNYLLDETNFSSITEISTDLLKCVFNPLQYIVSCMWFPFDVATIGTETIQVGWWTISGVQAKKLSDSVYTRNMSFNIPKHPQATARGNYLNMAPFSSYSLSAGPWGIIPISNINTIDETALTAIMNVDLYTGSGRFSIIANNVLTYVDDHVAQIGVPIQLGQNVLNQGALSNALSGANNAAWNALTGNPIGLLGGGLQSIGSIAELSQSIGSTLGSNGSMAFNTTFRLLGRFLTVADDDITNHGRPLCKVVTISSLSGFIMCENADLDTTATPSEKATIISNMNSGFYYE